jgi:hypothetical protein
MWPQQETRERVGAMERLLADLAAHQDSPGGAAGTAAAQALVDVYGEALARIMDVVAHAGDGMAAKLAEALVSDELIAQLLLVHDLHPIDAEARVRAVLAELPGVRAELISINAGVAEVRAAAKGCGATRDSARATVEDAVRIAAPEVAEVRVSDGGRTSAPAAQAFVPLTAVRAR